MIATRADLAALLRPLDLSGVETVRFRLDCYASRLTRELLTLRLRRQAQVLEIHDALLPTALAAGGSALDADVAALTALNALVRDRLAMLDGAIRYLRLLAALDAAQARAAAAFERAIAAGWASLPLLLAHIDHATRFQACGALRFCLPGDLADRVDGCTPGDVATLLEAEEMPLWAMVRTRELALARVRLASPATRYARARGGFQRSVGYLGAEDIAFESEERADAIDTRVAALGDRPAIERAHAALTSGLTASRARRRAANARFAQAVPPADLVALVLLARTVAAHEDSNRRAKMRLLRNLRDLCRHAGLDVAQASLDDLASAADRV